MSGRRRSSPWASSDLRLELAEEAARLMVEHGIQDFALAKRKAAERLGVRAHAGALPSNAQIHERLVERQRLFEPEAHDQRLAKLRCRDGCHGRARRLSTEARRRRPRRHGDGELADRATRLQRFAGSRRRGARGARAFVCTIASGVIASAARLTEQIPGFDLMVDDEELQVMVFPERGPATRR